MVKLKLVSLITNGNSLMFICNVNSNKNTSNKQKCKVNVKLCLLEMSVT